jgi:predicted transcriptional regulator
MGDNPYDDPMSKITFRADDDLIAQLEEYDASKSEVMREALREYLEGESSASAPASDGSAAADAESLDDLVAERVDAIVSDRLEAVAPSQPQDVNVNITLDGDSAPAASADAPVRKTDPEEAHTEPDEGRKTCAQCGENVGPDHVYCPNCGEKASHRVFCDCGDELRSDWGFCPSCGRRTPAADVLDNP